MDPVWIDVTRPLRDGLATWPGDPPCEICRVADFDHGAPARVSRLSMSSHAGTHVDAPQHFLRDGAGVDRMPAEVGIGPARVIEVRDRIAIHASDLYLHGIEPGSRVLLRTRNSADRPRRDAFDPDYAHLAPDAAALLAALRVRLVGIDGPSVGGRLGGVDTHRILLAADVWIVEDLDLSGARPGDYYLVCLPLRIDGADGAPARVFVKPIVA
jgi:arylformamidase